MDRFSPTGRSTGSSKLDKIIVVRTAGDAPYDYDADANLKRLAVSRTNERLRRPLNHRS